MMILNSELEMITDTCEFYCSKTFGRPKFPTYMKKLRIESWCQFFTDKIFPPVMHCFYSAAVCASFYLVPCRRNSMTWSEVQWIFSCHHPNIRQFLKTTIPTFVNTNDWLGRTIWNWAKIFLLVLSNGVLLTNVCYSQLVVIIENVSCCSVGIPIDIFNSYLIYFLNEIFYSSQFTTGRHYRECKLL